MPKIIYIGSKFHAKRQFVSPTTSPNYTTSPNFSEAWRSGRRDLSSVVATVSDFFFDHFAKKPVFGEVVAQGHLVPKKTGKKIWKNLMKELPPMLVTDKVHYDINSAGRRP
jgi:hypothetical protein